MICGDDFGLDALIQPEMCPNADSAPPDFVLA
jgi:hypothetical protein